MKPQEILLFKGWISCDPGHFEAAAYPELYFRKPIFNEEIKGWTGFPALPENLMDSLEAKLKLKTWPKRIKIIAIVED